MAVSQATTRRWSFAEDVQACQQAGLGALGIWRWKLAEFGEDRAMDLLRETGMAVTSLASAGGFTGSDGYSHEHSIAEARQGVFQAALIRASCLVVVSGSRANHTWNHARRMVCEALRSLGDVAGELGVSIAVQPVRCATGRKCTFLNTLDAALDVIHQADHPQVGLVFDVFQLAEEVELAARVPEIAPVVKLVTLSDRQGTGPQAVRCLPGEGTLPLVDLVQGLEASGYRGPYEVHAPVAGVWNRDPSAVLQHCQEALQVLLPSPVAARS